MIIISNVESFLSLRLKHISIYNSEKVILYRDFYEKINNEKLKNIFSILHSRLNDLLTHMNYKNTAGHGGHYNANESRDLIDIIEQLRILKATLKDEYSFDMNPDYDNILKACRAFLAASGGSPIPNDFPNINIIEDQPIFILTESTEIQGPIQTSVKIKLIGEGSYAKVFKYRDPYYGCEFVIKRANDDLRPDELIRFKNEYRHLETLDSPFIIKVYFFNDEKNEYTMELADETLEKFISKNNDKLPFVKKSNLVFHVLNAFEYIHSNGLLHRDISYQNVLIKHYDDGFSLVKVSDFGLVKHPESKLTRQGTEIKGSINDYSDLMVVGFENYEIRHETYAIAQVIYFILTGRKTGYHREKNVQLKNFIMRAISSDKENRFKSTREMRKELVDVVFPSLRAGI